MYCKFVDQFIEAVDACTEAVGQACRAALMGLRTELQRSGARSRLIAILFACAIMLQPNALFADMIPVRHTEGLIHGFLLVLTFEGKALADGQMTQDAQGDRVTNHLIFRFKDGSIYEDTTVFSQRGTFRLLSDHLILRGPSLKQRAHSMWAVLSGEYNWQAPESSRAEITGFARSGRSLLVRPNHRSHAGSGRPISTDGCNRMLAILG